MEPYQYIKNNKYDILTPDGYRQFSGIRRLQKENYVEVQLVSGKKIRTSDTHTFISNGVEIYAKDLYDGCEIDGFDSSGVVKSIDYHTFPIELYDVVEVDYHNLFISDGVVSHNCTFTSSGNSVIEMDLIQFYNETFIREPIEKRGLGGDYWLWEYPPQGKGNKSYLISADVARGDGSDYSTFHVIDLESSTQVAEYKGRPDTTTFGTMLVTAAIEWNNALLIIERENQGWAVIQHVINMQYPNLFYISKDLKYVETERMMNNRINSDERSMVPGFTTNSHTRPLVISKLDAYMREHAIIIQSSRTTDELFTFIWFSGRAQAMRSYNDDLVMALSIGLWVRDTALKLRQEGIDLTKKILDNMQLGGTGGMSVYSNNALSNDPYKISLGNDEEDIRWLLG